MYRAVGACFVLVLAEAGLAQIDVGSDGSDGAFTFVPDDPINDPGTMTIDLSHAASLCDCDSGGIPDDPCRWDCPSPVPGRGVYDADKWAVVFKYTSLDIASGVTVKFSNHATHAPVVWLVQENAAVSGTIDLNGQRGHDRNEAVRFAEPGPGGFRGGRGSPPVNIDQSAGFGPGGGFLGDGDSSGSGGSYASAGGTGDAGGGGSGAVYGNARILPLIGGSGGSGARRHDGSGGGGAGGGALLLAADEGVLVRSTARITANGGRGGDDARDGGSGSGGALRFVADVFTIEGGAVLHAVGGEFGNGGAGGEGRVRFDANSFSIAAKSVPAPTTGSPEFIFPSTDAPLLRATMLNDLTVPADPVADFSAAAADVTLATTNPVTIMIDALNVSSASTVMVRVSPKAGQAFSIPAAFASGDDMASTWVASVSLPSGPSAIQVRAEIP